MAKNPSPENQAIEKILLRLQELEKRVSSIENNLALPKVPLEAIQHELVNIGSRSEESEDEGLESTVGEYGMAWLGNIVLLFGIVFLLQFFKSQGYIVFSSIFGLASVAGVYLAGYLIRQHYPYMSNLFTYNGHLLIFIVTLRLHFTSSDPLIGNKNLGLFLLLLVIGLLLYIAFRNKKQVLTGLVLFMIVITAILSNSTHFMLSLMVVIAAISVFFVYKFEWWKILMLSIFFVYSTFFLWSLNNPIVTHSFTKIETLQFGYIYLFACAFIYSMLALLPDKEKIEEIALNVSIIFNGLGFSSILGVIILIFFKDNYYILLGLISAFSIAFAALLQSRGEWRLSSALYALYGFAVLSISIAGIYKFPLAFLLLSIQSLLVVSMALWFRSKFIVIMNVVMFIGLLIAYLLFPNPLNRINFAFALVALITARVINWKKNRLEITTEILRNIYLIIGFLMTLVSLYRAVPPNYVTLSWTLAAGIFFILSLLLNNIKYRWLAISTMIVTAIYFFLFDLRHVSIGYRIIALLFLAIISLSFSTFYAKRMKKKRLNNSDPLNH
jgi:hypothetical protein